MLCFKQALAAIDKKAIPKDETKETRSTAPQVAGEISQNDVTEVASACWMQQ